MTSSTLLTITCVAITVGVAECMILSISLPQWYLMKLIDGTCTIQYKTGLFKGCREEQGNIVCIAFKGELLEGGYL